MTCSTRKDVEQSEYLKSLLNFIIHVYMSHKTEIKISHLNIIMNKYKHNCNYILVLLESI
jgi:hypothetical protein